MIKTISNGVIRINNLSFLDFSSILRGKEAIDRRTGYKVPKFILFWKGLTIPQVKEMYLIQNRQYGNNDN